MKKILALTAFLSIFASASLAQAADEYTLHLVCEQARMVPDASVTMELFEGGFTGLTTIQVTHFFLGHRNEETYVVQKQPMLPHIVGAPVIYQGEGIMFTINFTTAPQPDGKKHAHLEIG